MLALTAALTAALVALMLVPADRMPEWTRRDRHARRTARGEPAGW